MKKKLLSLLILTALLIPALSPVATVHVHAYGWVCDNCGEWYEETPDICFNCHAAECCADICEYCLACMLCASELGFHCPGCGETCVDPEFNDAPHCEECNRCDNCVTLYETSQGLMCQECLDLGEAEGLILCPNCEVNPIGHELEDEGLEGNYDVGDCGEHCAECYEANLCPECSECTLCKGVDLCEHCGICEECAINEGYHCHDCGACYAEVGQCPDEGEHCVNCCEYVCENCGTCAEAAGIEYCESCHMCEQCWEHCEVCGECYEDNGECEDHGDHCAECCIREGWICDQCGRCTEALQLQICEFCGLCEECCKENSDYYGVAGCILDQSTDVSEVDPSLHDEHHHILRYTSSSEECHDVWCAYPGCDYYLSDCTPHEFKWKTLKKATETEEGLRKGICVYCGFEFEEAVPKLDLPTYHFIKQPDNVSVIKEKTFVNVSIEIGVDGEYAAGTKYAGVAAIPYNEGDELPATWEELKKNVYSFVCIYYYGADKGDGKYTAVIYGESNYSMSNGGKYFGMTAQGTKLTWRLAIYDRRGGGSKVTYSEPFVIDWTAKHTQCVFEYVWGKVPYNSKYGVFTDGWYIANPSYNSQFYDGTYHWLRCKECGQDYKVAYEHRYKKVEYYNYCNAGLSRYVCQDCGHVLEEKWDGNGWVHIYALDLTSDANGHYKTCVLCGYKLKNNHEYEVKNVYTDCTKTVITAVCKDCGYVHLEHESGKGHKYTTDGDFNGWYGDTVKHWKVCTVCGYVNESEHTYKGGACSVCGIDIPQMAIVGTTCVHGGELHIKLLDDIRPDDKALFLAGKYSATWIDEDTGNTVGLGKTYELTPEDEGRQFMAEVSIIGGEDYYAYMLGPIHTQYMNVKGYPATCAAEGLKDHSVCLTCGGKFINGKAVTDVVIPKTNDHTYDNNCDPVCNVCGYERAISHIWSDTYSFTENGHCKECTVCGAASPLEPHDLNVTVIKAASCEADGLIHKTCMCGYDEDESIPAYEHKFEHIDAVPACCVNEGIAEHYYCQGCGRMSKDANGTEKAGLNMLKTPIDPNNHVGSENIGYTENEHYVICLCGEHIEKGPHTFDESGRCTFCHYKQGSAVKTGGKELTKHDAVHATCISAGKKEYYTDENGKIYLSKAGMIEVTVEDLIVAKSDKNHVGGDIAHSEAQHWIDCACGQQIKKAAHTFGDDLICTFCGYQQPGEANTTDTAKPAETDGTAEPGGQAGSDKDKFPWWIIIIIAVIVMICIILIVILSGKNKKKNEEKEKETAAQTEPEEQQKPKE